MRPKKPAIRLPSATSSDPRTRMRDDQRAARSRNRRPPAGKRLDLAHQEERAEHQGDAESRADICDLSGGIGQRVEEKDLAIGDERAERELPCPRPGEIEGADRIDRRQDDAGGQRGKKDPDNDGRQQAPSQPVDRKQEDGPDEIELFLDAEGPEVQQRLCRGIRAEIAADAGESEEPEVDGKIRIAEQAAADIAELGRSGAKPADDPDAAHHYQHRGQDAPGALGVEHRERKAAGGAFRQDDARDEKTRYDEEHVDAGKAARDERAIGVESDDAEHRERAQSVDVLPEIEAAAGARGGDVRDVERFVQ